MADKSKQKENTPPPLLLMPSSEGLTFNANQGGSLLMPVPQMDASLMAPVEDLEGEVDSFLGQSPPTHQQPQGSQTSIASNGSAPVSFFQANPTSAPDPFAQIGQVAPPPVPASSASSPQWGQSVVPPPPGGYMQSPFSNPQVAPPPVGGGSPSDSAFTPPRASPVTMVNRPVPLPGGVTAPPTSWGTGQDYHRPPGRPKYAPPPMGTYSAGSEPIPHGGLPPPPPQGSQHYMVGAPPQGAGLPAMGPPSQMGLPPSHSPPSHPGAFQPPPHAGIPPPAFPTSETNPGQPGPSGFQMQTEPQGLYEPVHHHWYYCKNVELRQIWQPFSCFDSKQLEEAFLSGSGEHVIISTEGGRYDVDLQDRTRMPVYWNEPPSGVRRCSWFYKPEGDGRFVPYEEQFADRLEEEYKNAVVTNVWHKRLEFPGGETIVMHNAQVAVHFRPTSQPDEWGTTQGDQFRPRVVKRGVEDVEAIGAGEPSQIDHLVFIVHGIGPTCDLRFRNIIECVDDMRNVSLQMLGSHYNIPQTEGRIGRVEFLPVRWHQALHGDATGVDRRLKAITLHSISKLRHFTNDTLLDILFYASPTYAQKIADTVGHEMNRLFDLFLSRNPGYGGGVSVAGHSLGSLILFDLLVHQHDPSTAKAGSTPGSMPATSDLTLAHSGSGSQLSTRESTPAAELNGEARSEEAEEELSLEQLMSKLGLNDYLDTFQKEQMDVDTLMMCEDSDIKEMGLPLGPRKKLQGFIREHKRKQEMKKAKLEQEAEEEAQRTVQEQVQIALTGPNGKPLNKNLLAVTEEDPLLHCASSTSVSYMVGTAGTGIPFVAYPQLKFQPANFFALGSPVAMFLTVRGVEELGEEFHLPSCPGFFNIFHPFDPVAYRVEPMVTTQCPPKPVLMPHHKGRKRLHLELKEGLTRMGADIKQKMIDYVKTTWQTINDFAASHRSAQEQVQDAISQITNEEEDTMETASIASSMPEEDVLTGSLNGGRRIDYVLQEKPIESFNDYLFALGSHACYWESEDTVLLLLKEIYSMMGIAPQRPRSSTALSPQQTNPPPTFPRHPMAGGPGLAQATAVPPMGGPPRFMSSMAQPPPTNQPPPSQHPAAQVAPPPMSGFVRK